MEITISVSARAEQKIREQAASSGKDVSEFVGEFVEANFANGKMNGNDTAFSEKKPERRFMRMEGMFSGGDGNSAERVKEIMLSEVDSVEGLSKR